MKAASTDAADMQQDAGRLIAHIHIRTHAHTHTPDLFTECPNNCRFHHPSAGFLFRCLTTFKFFFHFFFFSLELGCAPGPLGPLCLGPPSPSSVGGSGESRPFLPSERGPPTHPHYVHILNNQLGIGNHRTERGPGCTFLFSSYHL